MKISCFKTVISSTLSMSFGIFKVSLSISSIFNFGIVAFCSSELSVCWYSIKFLVFSIIFSIWILFKDSLYLFNHSFWAKSFLSLSPALGERTINALWLLFKIFSSIILSNNLLFRISSLISDKTSSKASDSIGFLPYNQFS